LITVVPLPRAAMTMMRISSTSAMAPMAIQIGLVHHAPPPPLCVLMSTSTLP
jgi:hypothetical protein